MVSLEFFIDIILPMALGLTQPLTEMRTRNISWGQRRSVHRADNLTTFMCRLSWNLGTSTSWNPEGLPRPVMGLLYFYVYYECAYCLETYLFSFALREILFPCGVKRHQILIGSSSSDNSFRAVLQPVYFHGPQAAYHYCDILETSLTCLFPLPFLYMTHETWYLWRYML